MPSAAWTSVMFELVAERRRLVVLEAGVRIPSPGAGGEPMQSRLLHLGGQLRVDRDDSATLDGGDVLGHVEGERSRVAKVPDSLAVPFGSYRLGGILQHRELALVTQPVDPIEVKWPAREMDGHDGLGARRDRLLGGREIDQSRTRFGIHEDRLGSRVLDRVRARDESHRGHQHLVTRPDLEIAHRQEQGGGAGGDAPSVGNADVGFEHSLEALNLGTRTDPAGSQRIDDLIDLGLLHVRPAEDQEILPHHSSAPLPSQRRRRLSRPTRRQPKRSPRVQRVTRAVLQWTLVR